MFRGNVVKFVENCWYSQPGPLFLLLPLEWFFRLAVFFRRNTLIKKKQKIPVPTIVVGNITVGGTGKTPVIIALAKYLKSQGYHPGVISRGYSKTVDIDGSSQSIIVDEHSDPKVVGDEPLVIAEKAHCPVVINRDRVMAGMDLIRHYPKCNVILSDDGLQHYNMHRDIEICIFDADRQLGNRHQLPVGPLRESVARASEVDWILVNGSADTSELGMLTNKPIYGINVNAVALVNIVSGERKPPEYLAELERFIAVAGIGNPEKFYRTLSTYTRNFEQAPFTDHHSFELEDFVWFGDRTLVMTGKDAVKCRGFAKPNWWYLDIDAKLEEAFFPEFHEQLDAVVQKLSHLQR